MMLMIEPSIFSRFITFRQCCIRKNGARTLTANMASNSAGSVSQIDPRSVRPAELTRISMRPNALSAAATIFSASSVTARSAGTKIALAPIFSSAALTFSPRAALRPVTTRPAAPRSANRRAMASPSPWVEPVTIATLPSSESDFTDENSNIGSLHRYRLSGLAQLRRGVGQHLGAQPVMAIGRRLLPVHNRIDEGVDLVAIGSRIALQEEILHRVRRDAAGAGEAHRCFVHVAG